MTRSVRKVLQIGDCAGITLPHKYLKKSKIERGDYVEVNFQGERAEIVPVRTGGGASEEGD